MKFHLILLSFILIFKNDIFYSQINFSSNTVMIFDSITNNKNWKTVDDVVMGGISSSKFFLNEKGNAVFKGNVSTQNNGGFSSVRNTLSTFNIKKFTCFVIRLKGDGKNYQFRVKSSKYDYHSFKYVFSTNSNWQEIVIPFENLEPSYRGRKLDMPNFSNEFLEEVGFLISNKKEEKFELEINYIKLK